MKIFAHRGYSGKYLENTISAFTKALELNIDGIEVDVHQVEDEFALYHDFNFARLGEPNKNLADLSLAELKQTSLENGDSIPLLDELFEVTKGKVALNLELKRVTDTQALLSKIQRYLAKYPSKLIVSSFDHPLLAKIKAEKDTLAPELTITFAALIAHLPIDLSDYAVDLSSDIAAIDKNVVNQAFVESAHDNKLEVFVYTINSDKEFANMQRIGVDGIFTNYPETMLSLNAL